MKIKMIRFLLCLILGVGFSASSARANVYATDIKLNGSLSSITNPAASPVTISYILNQSATLGVTVAITQGTNPVVSLTGGANMGLNSVVWGLTNSSGAAVPAGVYSLSITAGAEDVSGGAGSWTQISIDGANTAANYPLGMDVDKNTNSPYYGRVVVGCAVPGTIYGVAQSDGLYKANADGSPADEGAFGDAGYATNDYGDIGTNQMPDFGSAYHDYNLPGLIKIGGDDRIYFIDQSANGAVVACDIRATTNQLVICEGPGNSGTGLGASTGYHNSPHNYAGNPDGGLLNINGEGWGQFDVAGFETGHPALYLVDTGDSPSAGVWMYHLTNGASDPADTVGTQVVDAGTNQSLFVVTGSGVSVDAGLDVFVGQNRSGAADPLNRVFAFTNWNGGLLPPEGGAATYALPLVEKPAWMVGSSNAGLTSINDIAVNSRSHPTLVAAAINGGAPYPSGYNGQMGGITILSSLDGSAVVTNLDVDNWYTSVAFDNVGNVYGCSTTINYWRAWSPPGPNTNTTMSLAQVIVAPAIPVIEITGVTAVPTGSGCATVTISFTGPTSLSVSESFKLLGSATANGTYSPVAEAVLSGSSGSYNFTLSNCSTEFYKVELTGL